MASSRSLIITKLMQLKEYVRYIRSDEMVLFEPVHTGLWTPCWGLLFQRYKTMFVFCSSCDSFVVDVALFLLQCAMLGKMVHFAWLRGRRVLLPRRGPPLMAFLSRASDLAMLAAMMPVIYFSAVVFSFWCVRKSNAYSLLPFMDEHDTAWMQIVDPSFSAI